MFLKPLPGLSLASCTIDDENARAMTSGLRKIRQKVLQRAFSLLRSTLSSRQKSRLALLFPKLRQKSETRLLILLRASIGAGPRLTAAKCSLRLRASGSI